jgi:hypothetical protein
MGQVIKDMFWHCDHNYGQNYCFHKLKTKSNHNQNCIIYYICISGAILMGMLIKLCLMINMDVGKFRLNH